MRVALMQAAKMLDPKTRRATAFYAALGVSLWDVITRGFHFWNTAFLAALCGLSVAGALGLLMGKEKPKNEPSGPPGAADEEA